MYSGERAAKKRDFNLNLFYCRALRNMTGRVIKGKLACAEGDRIVAKSVLLKIDPNKAPAGRRGTPK